jgi:hypothetical protein
VSSSPALAALQRSGGLGDSSDVAQRFMGTMPVIHSLNWAAISPPGPGVCIAGAFSRKAAKAGSFSMSFGGANLLSIGHVVGKNTSRTQCRRRSEIQK